jgi:hypothetical protein
VSHPLAPRARPSAEALAVVTAAAYALLAAPAADPTPPSPAWRFSGRWFSAHPYSALRRPSR